MYHISNLPINDKIITTLKVNGLINNAIIEPQGYGGCYGGMVKNDGFGSYAEDYGTTCGT